MTEKNTCNCRRERGEEVKDSPNYPRLSNEEARKVLEGEMMPALEKQVEIHLEILNILAKLHGGRVQDMGEAFGFILANAMHIYAASTAKPNTPADIQAEMVRLWLEHGMRGAKDAHKGEEEVPAEVKAFADMLGIDISKVTVF